MSDEPDLLRFIEGDCTPEEAARIRAWIAADPARSEQLDQLSTIWRLTGETSRRWDVRAARERLMRARGEPVMPGERALSALAETGALPVSRPVAPSRPAWRGWVGGWQLRVAAAAALVAIGLTVGYNRSRDGEPRDYATAPGQRAELSLPDGSRVLLSVDTRLRVPGAYGERERAVDLEGEAYFIVRHDATRPFLVRTRHGTAEDLGTAFDVRAYREESYLQVVVAEGSVAIRRATGADTTSVTLRARDRAVLDSRGVITLSANVRPEDHVSWTKGTLVFEDAPLDSVIPQLERWYDIEVQLGDQSLGKERVTISFVSETADEAFTALTKVLNVRVTRAGRVVRLVPLQRG